MDRVVFLNQLRHSLNGLSEDEINDIIQDYEEHFEIGLSKGKSEEEIPRELGNPKDIAKNYINSSVENNINKPVNTNTVNSGRKLILFILLGLFNLIIVLGPYLGIIGILLGVFALAFGFFFIGIGILFGAPFVAFGNIQQFHILTVFSFSIGFIALGILVFILSIYLAKLLYKLTVKYVRWNIDVING